MARRPAAAERRPSVGLPTDHALRTVYAGAEDGIAQLRPLRDARGDVVDAEVVAWNRSFAVDIEPRLGRRLTAGTLLSEYACDLHLTLEHLSEAMSSGRSIQFLPGRGNARDGCSARCSRRLLWHRFEDCVFGQVTDLSEYQQLQEQLADQRSLAALAAKARTLAEERERIARNLHDTVIQRLYATTLELEFLAMDGTPPPERTRLGRIGRDLQHLITQIRDEIFDVQHHIEGGLREELLDVMLPMAQTFGVSVEVATDLKSLDDADLAQNLRAVVRESSSNAIRHGHASRVLVRVAETDGILEVEVTDNGIGMAVDAGPSSGLTNLLRRAELAGGRLEVAARPEGGVRVLWCAQTRPGRRQFPDSWRVDDEDVPTMTVALENAVVDGTTGGNAAPPRANGGGGGVGDQGPVVRRP